MNVQPPCKHSYKFDFNLRLVYYPIIKFTPPSPPISFCDNPPPPPHQTVSVPLILNIVLQPRFERIEENNEPLTLSSSPLTHTLDPLLFSPHSHTIPSPLLSSHTHHTLSSSPLTHTPYPLLFPSHTHTMPSPSFFLTLTHTFSSYTHPHHSPLSHKHLFINHSPLSLSLHTLFFPWPRLTFSHTLTSNTLLTTPSPPTPLPPTLPHFTNSPHFLSSHPSMKHLYSPSLHPLPYQHSLSIHTHLNFLKIICFLDPSCQGKAGLV